MSHFFFHYDDDFVEMLGTRVFMSIDFALSSSYTIIRVAGYNADLGTDSSVVRLQKVRLVYGMHCTKRNMLC